MIRRLLALALALAIASRAGAAIKTVSNLVGTAAEFNAYACNHNRNKQVFVIQDASTSTCTIPSGGGTTNPTACVCNGALATWYIMSGGGGGGTPSALLDGGTMHTDTTNSAVTRGDLIYGNSTPAWDDLALGAAGKYIRSDGTDLSWQFITYSDITGLPTTGNTQYKLYNTTTNATLTELFLNGSSTRLTMPNSSTWTVTCWVAARRTDATGGRAGWKLDFVVFKDTTAGSTAFVGSLVKMTTGKADSAWDVTALPDTSNGTPVLKVTGEAAKTIDWVASCLIAEAT